MFHEEFNKFPLELFKEFDYNPIAAASLAQVHKAIDHENRICAVKLQYIDLQDRYPGDILTVQTLLKLMSLTFPNFSLSWVFDVCFFLSILNKNEIMSFNHIHLMFILGT